MFHTCSSLKTIGLVLLIIHITSVKGEEQKLTKVGSISISNYSSEMAEGEYWYPGITSCEHPRK